MYDLRLAVLSDYEGMNMVRCGGGNTAQLKGSPPVDFLL